MNERCRAKNPSTCRTHGTGAGQAVKTINQHIDSGKVSRSALFAVAAMKESAENYNPDNRATGMVVEYEDGTTELFYGEATDPYKATDWSFVSASTHNVVKGYQYTTDADDYDDASMGVQTIKDYQEELSESLVGSYPILAEGPDNFAGDKKVAKVTVL
jgi:hypothetical protein